MPDATPAVPLPATMPAIAPELCVVVPVLNERDNILPLVEKLRAVLAGVAWEVIFVDDDSRDGTRDAVAAIGLTDPRVRLLHRIGRRGLSSAFIEGAQASIAPYVAAMDGDLQHDEAVLPRMLAALRDDGIELAIGSRYVAGGGVGEWDSTRAGMSSLATRLSQLVLHVPVADPMSGFFMIRRDTFERAVRRLSAMGFKILLDIIASLPEPPRIRELPYTFRTRVAGESKLDAGVLRDYVMLIIDKLVGHIVPVRFILFAGVGALGIAAHLIVLKLGLQFGGLDFAQAQAVATGVRDPRQFLAQQHVHVPGSQIARLAFSPRAGDVLDYLQRRRGWEYRRGVVPVRHRAFVVVAGGDRRGGDEPGVELCGIVGVHLAARVSDQ